MSVRAKVRDGRLLVDEPTSLPDGTELELVVDDGGDELDVDELAALNASLTAGLEQARRGETMPIEDILAKLRLRRTQ